MITELGTVDADDHTLIIINFTTSKKKKEQIWLIGTDADGHG